jgi:two-component system, NarL family, sensor kinase
MIPADFRISLTLILATCLANANGYASGPPFQQGPPYTINTANDSAQYYFDMGQAKPARTWIGRALAVSLQQAGTEPGRTYLLLGDLEEEEGYISLALDAYHKSRVLVTGTSKSMHARTLNGIANCLTAMGNYDSVLLHLDKSVKLDSSLRNQVMTHLAAARYWLSQNLHDRSLPHWQQAYDKATALKDAKLMALALGGMARIYFNQDTDMNVVLDYLRKTIALCDSARHANIIAQSYTRMANACMVMNKGKEAGLYLERAKRITDLSGNLPVHSYVLASLAILRLGDGDINGSVQFAEEAIRIKRRLGQLLQLKNDLLNISETYMFLKKFDQAREALREGTEISKGMGDVVYLEYFYRNASVLDSLTGNYGGAYSNLKRSVFYKDSAQSLKRFRAVEEVREQYEAEQKEKTIAEKEVVIQRQKYQQAVIAGVSVIAVLVLVVILIMLRNRHKIRLQLEKQQQNHLRMQTIVHTQEEVQQSIARDIHDGLVQVLGAAKMSLEAVDTNSDKSLMVNRIREASRIMDEACAEARNISHQILPYSLMKEGLVPALEELLRKSLVAYEFRSPPELKRLEGDLEINVYRIAQELVNNIIKHAEAYHVSVDLVRSNGSLVLSFRDDGKGFDQEVQKQGAGFTNIMTRAELIGGRALIESNPGKGTFVQLTVPI